MSNLALIFSFVTVLVVVLGIAINGIVSKVLAHKRWERENSAMGTQSRADQAQLSDRTDLIEDRLRVLERIATDRGQTLSDEIEELRGSITSDRDAQTREKEPS